MDPRRITQQISQYKSTEHQDIGRPRQRWEDDLETEQAVIAYPESDEDGIYRLEVGINCLKYQWIFPVSIITSTSYNVVHNLVPVPKEENQLWQRQ
jgi:hypothetical protein